MPANRIEIAGKYGHNLAFLTAIPQNDAADNAE